MGECYWSEESAPHLLAITRDTHYDDKKKSSGQDNLFNIGTIRAMERTSAQPQVTLSLLR
jgi:hypothetical protein